MRLHDQWGGPLRITSVLVLILASVAGADTFTVTRNDDPVPDGCQPADCSLREAVIDANANGLEDTIILSAGTYALSIPGRDEDAAVTGDLDITQDLEIEGADARSTIIDGGALDRIFEVLSGAVVSVSDLTIRNGLTDGAGGGIRNSTGNLTMARCSLIDNISDGGLGGGLHGAGTVLIVESTVKENIAWRGGGLSQWNGGTLSVVNSTISGNMATDWGGGVYSANEGTTVQLMSVTITGNVADADDDGFGGGGGLFADSSGVIELGHTIVANNLALGGEVSDCKVPFGQLPSTGYNLIGDTRQCAVSGDETGNLYDIDPLLSPIASNGGRTNTHALQPGSPAIDAGNPAGCMDENGAPLTADQRGEPRPYDGDGDTVAVCDMGAFEVGLLVFSDGFESGNTSAWSVSVP